MDFERVCLPEKRCALGCKAACSAHTGFGGCPPRLCVPKPPVAAVRGYTQRTELTNKAECLQNPGLGYPCYTHI